MGTIHSTFSYLDPDQIEFLVDYRVTLKGYPPEEDDPGAPSEIEIIAIESRGYHYTVPFEGLDELIERIEAAILEEIDG